MYKNNCAQITENAQPVHRSGEPMNIAGRRMDPDKLAMLITEMKRVGKRTTGRENQTRLAIQFVVFTQDYLILIDVG
jgi:hypothetical protein